MKTIVVSGAKSNIGKTTLAREIAAFLPGSVQIKIGHGEEKDSKGETFYHLGTPFAQIAETHASADWLVLESNSVLREINPDLAFFLPGDEPKPSAALAEKKADIRRGKPLSPVHLQQLSAQCGLNENVLRKMAWLAGARPESTTAIILAGGKSRRMGQDKALLEVNGTSALMHIASQLKPWFDEILVSVAPGAEIYSGDLTRVIDSAEGQGPLQGIASALESSANHTNFVIACDIPLIHFALLNKLLSLSEDHEIVIPSFKQGTVEPLFGIYSKATAARARDALSAGRRRVTALYDSCDTFVLPSRDSDWYANLNTPQDYQTFLASPHGSQITKEYSR